MSYSKDLRKRLFPPRPLKKPLSGRQAAHRSYERFPTIMATLHKEELLEQRSIVPPHPGKYPKHPGLKGSLYNGECNRTACDSDEAVMFNIYTRGYYCRLCAASINYKPGNILCVPVDHDLAHEEMNNLYDEQSRKG